MADRSLVEGCDDRLSPRERRLIVEYRAGLM